MQHTQPNARTTNCGRLGYVLVHTSQGTSFTAHPCLHEHVHVHTCHCAHTCTCTHMSLHTHVHMHTHTHAHTHTHTHTHTRAHAHASRHTHITLCCFNFFPRKSPMLPTSLSTAKKQRTHTPTCALHSNAPLFLPDPKCALFSCHTPTCALHSNAPLFLLDPEPPRCLPQPAPTAARAARIPPP